MLEKQDSVVKLNPAFTISIERIKLFTELENLFKDNGIYYLGDLLEKTKKDLLQLQKVTNRDISKINTCLSKKGLELEAKAGLYSKNQIKLDGYIFFIL